MSVWHDNTEVPKLNSLCLVVISSTIRVAKFEESKHHKSSSFYIPHTFVLSDGPHIGGCYLVNQIEKWAYADEIVREARK